jgi:hypothetical protein
VPTRIVLALTLLLLMLAPTRSGAEEAGAPSEDLQRELEREMREDRAAEQARQRETGPDLAPCVRSEAELTTLGQDLIRYRKLARDDFRAPRNQMRGRDVAAHVGLLVACVGRGLRLEQRPDGRWEAWLEDVRYFALLDRQGSWWDDRSGMHPEWVLRHEQGHFDLAELVVRRHNAELARSGRAAPGVGASDEQALAASDRLWVERLRAIWAEFRAIEDRYDQETYQGPKHQTRWFERILRELAATRPLAER